MPRLLRQAPALSRFASRHFAFKRELEIAHFEGHVPLSGLYCRYLHAFRANDTVATAAKRLLAPITPHDGDFYTWAMDTAVAIRAGRFENIDWRSVAEELEDMGRSERRALESRIEVLLAHLIKWRYQSEYRSTSWTGTIKEQRRKAARLLKENPGLKPSLDELIPDAYETAKALAERDTGIDEQSFPRDCPWHPEQILNESFWPENV